MQALYMLLISGDGLHSEHLILPSMPNDGTGTQLNVCHGLQHLAIGNGIVGDATQELEITLSIIVYFIKFRDFDQDSILHTPRCV